MSAKMMAIIGGAVTVVGGLSCLFFCGRFGLQCSSDVTTHCMLAIPTGLGIVAAAFSGPKPPADAA